jgi:hypothetical protein
VAFSTSFTLSASATFNFKSYPTSGQVAITASTNIAKDTPVAYTAVSPAGSVTVGSMLVSGGGVPTTSIPIVTAITATQITFSVGGWTATGGTYVFQSYPFTSGTVALPAGSVVAGTPYYFSGSISGTIAPGSIVYGAGLPPASPAGQTTVLAVTYNSITFSQGFTATASTYTFSNQFSELTNALLRYDPPTIAYNAESGLFSMHVDPTMVIGSSLVPTQNTQTGSSPTTSGKLTNKYRLYNGVHLDGSYAVGQGPLLFPGVNMSYIETWTIYFNEPLQNLMPFPIAQSKDYDSSVTDAFSNQLSFFSSQLNAYPSQYITSGLSSTSTQFVLSLNQEFNSTASWSPFIGFAITTNSIPAQMETSGSTVCTAGSTPLPQIGNTTHPVLFDYNFDQVTGHEILQGISYNPSVYRWVGLAGGPISDIGFYVYLKKRDGTYVAWNLPGDSMIDIKFLFSRHAGTQLK